MENNEQLPSVGKRKEMGKAVLIFCLIYWPALAMLVYVAGWRIAGLVFIMQFAHSWLANKTLFFALFITTTENLKNVGEVYGLRQRVNTKPNTTNTSNVSR